MSRAQERTASSGPAPYRFSTLAGIVSLAVLWGAGVAVAGANALYLCIALIGCAFILFDFRIGVSLLVMLMPISASTVFPHAMFGITGLNPLNLLLAATLGACLLRGLSDGSLRRILPRPLLWLYLLPIVAAGFLGSRHVAEIGPAFYAYEMVDFVDAAGYARDMVVKPMLLVAFALLVGAAVSRSSAPERFLAPMVISIWAVSLLVIAFVLQSGIGLGQLARSDSREFLSALGMHANELGRLFVIAYALLLFSWSASRQAGARLALLASMGLVVAALVLTFSRGAFVGFIVVNLLFLAWRRSAKSLVLFGLAASIALLALPAAVYERALSGVGEGLNSVSAGRLEGLWLPLLPEVMRSPIYGSGIGSIMWSEPMREGGGANVLQVTHPHNAYLQALLDMGVLGFALVCAFFVHVWWGFRTLRLDADLDPVLCGFYQGASAALLAFLVSSFTDGSFVPRPEQALLWFAIGMMYGQLDKRRAR
jgi:O-antigen ligase